MTSTVQVPQPMDAPARTISEIKAIADQKMTKMSRGA